MASLLQLSRPQSRRSVLTIVGLILLAVVLMNDSARSGGPKEIGDQKQTGALKDFTVKHNAVETTLVTPGSQGNALGDLRVLQATPVYSLDGALIGRLDAQLLTTSVNYPDPSDQIRMSTLNFVFGPGNASLAGSADQIIVSGSGFYPSSGSTIAVGNALVRPIVGGSGVYFGASGAAITEHLADGTWRHTFRFTRP
ncbi:MAG: hypothetical protein RIS70_1202 [Planctomycetota bacterium]|jgi:hypothetical protein